MSENLQQPAKSEIRILVVDDDREIRSTMTELIKLMGYDVETAENGWEAIKALGKSDFNMILTDIQMPIMSGLDLFHEVKSKNIPVVLMTGFSTLVDIGKATQMGAADFLAKPFSSDELKNSIALATRTATIQERTPEEVDNDYVRIYVPDYIGLGKNALDIYARTPEGSFARVARADNAQSQIRLRGFFEKGLRFLYVRKDDYALAMGFNLKTARTIPKAKKASSITEKMQFLRQAMDQDVEKTYSNSVPRDIFDYAKSVTEDALQMCIENDVLFQILQSLRKQHERAFVRSLGVSVYAVLSAKQVGWSGHNAAFKCALAGILHDIGKVDLPTDIITKPKAQRTLIEKQIFESHAYRGRDILREMPFITEEVIQAVANHHENNSSTGFPSHLSRLKIHPLAKMLHFVDTFCSEMMSDEAESLLNPMQVFLNIYPEHEDDFEAGFVRAVLEVFRVPIPEKLRKIQSQLDAKAKAD